MWSVLKCFLWLGVGCAETSVQYNVCETNIHQSEFCPPPSVKICLGRYSLCVCLFQISNYYSPWPHKGKLWPCFGASFCMCSRCTLFRSSSILSCMYAAVWLVSLSAVYFYIYYVAFLARAWSPGTFHSPWLVVSLIVFLFWILMSLLFRYWTLTSFNLRGTGSI